MTKSIATFAPVKRAAPEDAEPDQRRLRAVLDRDERREQGGGDDEQAEVRPDVQPYCCALTMS